MNYPATGLHTAYGDESVRMVGDPPFYMLGACIIDDASNDVLASLSEIMPQGSKKLHWRDMSQRLQRESLRLISDVNRVDMVVIASPLNGKKQERARRKCLEAALPELEARGVKEFILESRGAASDRNDVQFATHAKGSKLIKTIDLVHAKGSDEPRLWIADQIVGAMGDYITQAGNWDYWRPEWEAMSHRVERIDVSI